jgi:glycosyltransferase involved in cell wall biosynthesis
VSQRVLSVIHGPVYGGAHSQLIRLHEPLLQRGFETIALVPTEPGNARPRLEEADIEVVSLPLGRLRATANPGTQLRFAGGLRREVSAIQRVIRDRGVDVVQVHGPTNPHGALAARREGTAVVWQLYEMRTPMPLRVAFMPLVRRLSDVAMSTGYEVARRYPGAIGLGDRLVTFVPPVDTEEFRPDPDRRAAARRELGLPDEALAIGTLGNLNPDKGHEYLVRAAARLRGDHPNLRVRVLGAHSPPHARYEARVRSSAKKLGLEEERDIGFLDPGTRAADLLPAFDVFVLASRREGIPTAVLEAMACRVAVVTTDVGAVREVVEDGITGLVVQPRDPRALAEAIDGLLRDPGRRAAMAAAARQSVEQHHDLDACADAHAAAYRIAIDRHAPRGALMEPAEAR